MTNIGRITIFLLFLWPSISTAHAQAIPAATADSVPIDSPLSDVPGSLGFTLSASETVRSDYYGSGGVASSTNISGNAAYLSKSLIRPFSAVYSGGYFASTSGQPSSVFQNLALSQTLDSRLWNFVLSDTVRYLPETPATGLSGLPGLGDLGLSDLGLDSGQDILTDYAQRVTNLTSASAEYKATGSTSIQGTGSFLVQKFLDNTSGLDSNQIMASSGINHRIDALNSFGVNYSYSRFSYPSVPFAFIAQGINVQYTRQWNRRLQTNATLGPQRISSSSSASGSSSVNLAANVSLTYELRRASTTLSYVQGVRNGAGVVTGTLTESLHGTVNYRLSRLWSTSVLGSYNQNKTLQVATSAPYSVRTIIGGIQVSRKLGRHLSTYGSYTPETQSTQGSSGSFSAFSGLTQVVAFGLTYSPSLIHLGHQ